MLASTVRLIKKLAELCISRLALPIALHKWRPQRFVMRQMCLSFGLNDADDLIEDLVQVLAFLCASRPSEPVRQFMAQKTLIPQN